MNNTLDFKEANILVIGDIMLDRYWHGDTSRISPEAAVPIVHIRKIEERPGGAANVALNISALGGNVKLLGFVGDDIEANQLEQTLQNSNIECHFSRTPELPTINKLRIVSRGQQMIRLDFEEKFHHDNTQLQELTGIYQSHLDNTDIVILSDYDKGTLTDMQNLIQLARSKDIPVLVDPKSRDFSIYAGATLITPNLEEFEAVAGSCQSEDDLVQKAEQLRQTHDFFAILVTRGEHGMSLISEGNPPLHLQAKAREVYDVTGAGDTVIATLGTALAAGCGLDDAVTLANTAAGIVVRKLGAATVSPAELRRAMQRQQQTPEAGILTEEQLLEEVQDAKARGEKIVMTNGCFDILHAGHITYLEQAKALGHRLIVAVNDDASVIKLKGPTRPINSLPQRMLVLAALRDIDWVVPFSEETPARLIEAISPDILVKGGDYEINAIAGADFVMQQGGEVIIIPFVEGFSTTSMVEKIKN